jgi:hypothetical protein
MRRTLPVFILVLAAAWPLEPARSAQSRPARPKPTAKLAPKLREDFLRACNVAFKSSGSSPEAPQVMDDEDRQVELALTRRICECAADETKSQGATDAAVARETAAILKDARHKIEDRHVLDAFRYCAIETVHGTQGGAGLGP